MFAVVSLELEVSQETDKQQLALSSIFTEEYCNPAVRLKFFILRLHHSVFVIASCLIPVNSVKLSVNKSSSLQMFVSEPLLRSLKPTCALSCKHTWEVKFIVVVVSLTNKGEKQSRNLSSNKIKTRGTKNKQKGNLENVTASCSVSAKLDM